MEDECSVSRILFLVSSPPLAANMEVENTKRRRRFFVCGNWKMNGDKGPSKYDVTH